MLSVVLQSYPVAVNGYGLHLGSLSGVDVPALFRIGRRGFSVYRNCVVV